MPIGRREFLKTAFAASVATAYSQQASKPSIVFILADDLGWGDLGCYNDSSDIPTPNFNKFASEGMRFTDAHSPSAVCSPTRYGILTGRYCWRSKLTSGVLWGYSPALIEPGRMTVASMLKQQGYRTAGVGKWHLGLGTAEKTDYSKPLKPSPIDYGFDSYFGIPASLDMDPYVYIEDDHAVEQATETTPGKNEPRGVFWRPGPIAPGLKIDQVLPKLTSKAVGFLNGQKGSSQPFFLYLPLTAPHTPWVPDKKFEGKSKAGIYGDFVVQVDDSIGQVLQALERSGHAGNTLVIITSDNGAHWTPDDKRKFAHRANAQWRGMKADIWDAGHRIPFMVRWPGKVKPGSISNETICLTDFMATAAAVTGVKLPANAGEDSFDISPVLLGKSNGKPIREAIVHHSSLGVFSIRQGPWKLILGLGSGGFSDPKTIEAKAGEATGQLYNLAKDPHESTNLYLQEPDVVKRLAGLLERYKKQGRSRPAG